MPVDDVAMLAHHPEVVEDEVADLGVEPQTVIMALLLMAHGLICKEVTLKRGHLRLVEKRRVRAAPYVEVIVHGIIAHIGRRVVVERRAHQHAHIVEKLLALVPASHHLHFLERAVFVHGD